MTLHFVNAGPHLEEADLAAFERRRAIALPGPYRRFLLEHNGGEPAVGEGAPLPEGAEGAMAYAPHRFYSLGLLGGPIGEVDFAIAPDPEDEVYRELYHDLEAQLLWHRRLYGPDFRLLPIARVHYEGVLYLGLEGEDAGAISWCCDPDGYVEWHCRRVADSFDVLLGGWGGMPFL
jgi:hypothetical protein